MVIHPREPAQPSFCAPHRRFCRHSRSSAAPRPRESGRRRRTKGSGHLTRWRRRRWTSSGEKCWSCGSSWTGSVPPACSWRSRFVSVAVSPAGRVTEVTSGIDWNSRLKQREQRSMRVHDPPCVSTRKYGKLSSVALFCTSGHKTSGSLKTLN